MGPLGWRSGLTRNDIRSMLLCYWMGKGNRTRGRRYGIETTPAVISCLCSMKILLSSFLSYQEHFDVRLERAPKLDRGITESEILL